MSPNVMKFRWVTKLPKSYKANYTKEGGGRFTPPKSD